MAATEIEIGQLRWKVQVLRRQQAPTSGASGLDETETLLAEVYADIQPVGSLTFYGSVQVETPITHRVFTRWRFGFDSAHVIRRLSRGLDGVVRTETFRIRRQAEVNGRKRFTMFEVELEKQTA